MELLSTNTKQILQFLQLQQQTDSISLTTLLGYQNPESPSTGPAFLTKMFTEAEANSEVDGNSDFDEVLF